MKKQTIWVTDEDSIALNIADELMAHAKELGIELEFKNCLDSLDDVDNLIKLENPEIILDSLRDSLKDNAVEYTMSYSSNSSTKTQTVRQRVSTKIGRNKPCPCGSGNKFKKCCGKS